MKQWNNETMKKGFTLIELLVAAALIAIITALVLPNFTVGTKNYALKRAVHKLAQDIRRTQDMAVSSREFGGKAVPGGYGIYFQKGSESYILFADKDRSQTYNDPSEIIETVQMEKGVKITFLSSPSFSLTVIFVPPDPLTVIKPDAGWASIVLNATGVVKVNKTGLVEIE